jgi:hypothetical protein
LWRIFRFGDGSLYTSKKEAFLTQKSENSPQKHTLVSAPEGVEDTEKRFKEKAKKKIGTHRTGTPKKITAKKRRERRKFLGKRIYLYLLCVLRFFAVIIPSFSWAA